MSISSIRWRTRPLRCCWDFSWCSSAWRRWHLPLREGLLPEDESFDRWFKFVTRETGLIVGVLLVLVGLGAAAAEKPGGALRTNQSSQF